MKEELKYIAWIVVAVAIATIVMRLTTLLAPDPASIESRVIPADSGFVSIIQSEYKPRSTPFERPQRPDVLLPRGVFEKNVHRIVVITRAQRVRTSGELLAADTTRLIELKTGELFIQAEEGSEIKVQETLFVPPLLGWGWFSSAGVSVGREGERFVFSPVLGFSPLEVNGVVQLPLITTDLYGVGAGLGVRQQSLIFGLTSHWRFGDVQRSLKLSLQYIIN